MAAPVFVTAKSDGGFASERFVTIPSLTGLQAGDFIVAIVTSESGAVPSKVPAGWTQYSHGGDSRIRVYYRYSTSTSIPQAEWEWVDLQQWVHGIAAAYRGVDDVTPFDAVAVAFGTATAPSVSATATDGKLVCHWSQGSGDPNFTAPSGMTTRYTTPNLQEAPGFTADQTLTATGATGTRTATTPTTSYGPTATSMILRAEPNVAPNAPIITAPASGSTIDRNSVNRFDWDFSDPDAGDSQSKYDLRYRVVGAATWTTLTGTTPNTYWDAAAGTFAAGDYEWQVRTYDAQGVVGPYSASSFFTAGTAPSTPTITDPVNGATISSSEDVTWSAPDQDAYQIRRVADNAGAADTATVYYDSGEVTSSTVRTTPEPLTFETNDRYEHIQVRIKDNGLWSSWASIRVLVSYTPPSTPVVTLTPDETAGSLLVGITNPAPGAGEPALAYNDVYVDDGDGEERRVTGVLANGSWIYWLPKSGRDYSGSIRVVAVATNGTTSSSS